jgi:hypothetical protein
MLESRDRSASKVVVFDPDNLSRLASSLVRVPHSWSGGHEFESTAGQNLLR